MPMPTDPSVSTTTSDRDATVDAVLKSKAIKPEIQQQIREGYSTRNLSGAQLESILDGLPVDNAARKSLWNAYYTYDAKPTASAASVTPSVPTPAQPSLLGRAAGYASDLVGKATTYALSPALPDFKPPALPTVPSPSAVMSRGYYRPDPFETKLTPTEETQFQTWKAKNAPNDSGQDYDLRGAFKAGVSADPTTGHWPDTFKKPNHPTFSNQSQYAAAAPEKAGTWNGDTFIPPGRSVGSPSKVPAPPSPKLMAPKPETSYMDVVKQLPGGTVQAMQEYAADPVGTYKNALATIVKAGGGLLRGVTQNYYDPETGKITLPVDFLAHIAAAPFGSQAGIPRVPNPTFQAHPKLSDVLEHDWGVPKEVSHDATPAAIGNFIGQIYGWAKGSQAVSSIVGGMAGESLLGTQAGIRTQTIETVKDIAKGVLKRAALQGVVGAGVGAVENPDAPETDVERAERIGKTALYGAALSTVIDGLLSIPAANKSLQFEALGKLKGTLSDMFYKSGKFADFEEAGKAADEILNQVINEHGGIPKSGWSKQAADEVSSHVEQLTKQETPTPEAAPETPASEPVTAPAETHPPVTTPVKTGPTTMESAGIPTPIAGPEKPPSTELPAPPEIPSETSRIPRPKKQFTHNGQDVRGISGDQVVLADGSTAERAPSYIETLRKYGYTDLTPDQIQGLKGEESPAVDPTKDLPSDVTYIGPQEVPSGKPLHLYNLDLPDGTQATFAVREGQDVGFKALETRRKFQEGGNGQVQVQPLASIDGRGAVVDYIPKSDAHDTENLGPRWHTSEDLGSVEEDAPKYWMDGETPEDASAAISQERPNGPYTVEIKDGRKFGSFDDLRQAISMAEKVVPQKNVTPGAATPKALPGVPGAKTAGKTVSYTDNSVRDHPQSVQITGDTITVRHKVGRKTASTTTIPLSEWMAAQKGPSANPNWNERKLIEKYTEPVGMDEQPGGSAQADRIRDAVGYAIKGALKKQSEGSVPQPPALPTPPLPVEIPETTTGDAQEGASPEETKAIAEEFIQRQGDRDVTRIFDAPKKGEIVRLKDKVDAYQAKSGWMTIEEARQQIEQWKAHAAAQGETGANSNKIVLSLFDRTGEWAKPWLDAGYQVHTFDIQNDPEFGDVKNFSAEFFMDMFGDFEGQDVHAVIAACPCTDFAVSGARHFAAKDADGRTVDSIELVRQTLATIEYFKPAIWAIENPVGRIEKLAGLPPWRMSFDPNAFGAPYTKKTLLWGRFNGDLPIAPVEPVEGSKMHSQYGGKSQATKNARSVTPEGFAYSFFMANNAVDHPEMTAANKYDRLDKGLIDQAIAAGLTLEDIDHAVDDDYYMDLNDKSAEKHLQEAIDAKKGGAASSLPPVPSPSGMETPISPASPLPQRPTGPRWTNDPGAMPGEPELFLDGENADDPNTKAAIVESQVHDTGGVNWSAHLTDGTVLGPYGSVQEATDAAEKAVPEQTKGGLPDVPSPGIAESQGGAIHGDRPAEAGGETAAVGATEPSAGPTGGTGEPGGETVRGAGTRSGRDSRTGGRGADAIARGGVDNSGFYRITDADELGSGGAVTKFKDNLKAIKVLKSLMEENRLPTDAEKKSLARYVGWGSLSEKAFSRHATDTGELAQELEKLLTPDEWDAARASTKNAHYTSAPVVRFIWDLAQRLGFKGNGTILETSMGTGNFLGLAPDSAVQHGNFVGAELDPITGNIAKYLYPGAKIRAGGYETLMLPENSVDVAIGNVPFGDYKIYDPRYKDLKLLIHDYFFVKTLDKVRPGGLILFITSKGTLDKANDRVRELMADKANLVAAYRLPNTAFAKNAGTEVTTDVIILQKRAPSELRSGETFLKTSEIQPGMHVNEYFERHPENMLGRMALTGTMYGGNEPTLEPTEPLQTLMDRALSAAPQNVMTARSRAAVGTTSSIIDQVAPENIRELAYTVNDKGQLVQCVDGVLTKPLNPAVSSKDRLSQMKQLIDLREQVKKVVATQLSTDDDVPLQTEQDALNALYDAYVAKHGILNGKNTEIFSEDPQYPLLLALENYQSETKSATKSSIFSKRTIRPIIPLEVVSADPKEALIQVLADRGFPDIPFLAQLSKLPEEQVAKSLEKDNLIFQNPGTGTYEMAQIYLSGYVRDKLAAAEEAAQHDPRLRRNVQALQAVQPEPIPIKDIAVKFGASWIPETGYKAFIQNRILQGYGSRRFRPEVTKLPDGSWKVEFDSPTDVNLKWGSDYLSADDIMEAGMNLRRPTIWRKDSDGSKYVDQVATIAAREKLSQMKAEFERWASEDPDWSTELATIYNSEFNGIRLTEYDGSHLTLPGISSEWGLRAHQLNGVWRIVTDGRALLAHVVGSGKTFTMIAAGMELRRLGISKKNMFVVPNGKVEQWRDMFQSLYPAANILAIGREDLGGDRRRASVSRIATGDWDAVILQHSSFGRIPISPERMMRTVNHELEELEETLRAAQANAGSNKRDVTVKALEKAKERMKAHLEELKDAPKDNVLNFDDLGIDYMFVDEIHEFKNLTYSTKMSNISGLGQKDAKKGLDLKSKTDYLQEKNRGRGVIGATGTPVSNTMAEVYNMTRYVAPDVLANAGIRFFDDWAANFGDVVEVMELSPDGRTYKSRAKFSRFTNTPELITMFRSFTDIKHAHELNLPTPLLKGGQPQPVKIKSNNVIEPIFQELLARAEQLRANPRASREKGSDNWLKLTSDGKKIALDARLFDPTLPDHPDSKSNVAVRNIFDRWKRTKGTTQIVFADMYQDASEKFNLYKDMRNKLTEMGVPAKEIAIAQDFNSDDQLERMQRQMNAAEIRVLFGSTAKIGVGLNVQKRLETLHDLDAPWRPDQLEQRHGRIVRQGNENKEVEILQYVTERSFDAYIFQALETKSRFIRQIMSGEISDRNIDDAAGDVVLQYAELKAIASGNPDVKRKIELEQQINKWGSLEASHIQDDRTRETKIQSKQRDIVAIHTQMAHYQKTKDEFDAYLAAHPKSGDEEPFSVVLGGREISDRKEFIDYVENNKAEVFQTGNTATIYGVPVTFETVVSPNSNYGIVGVSKGKKQAYRVEDKEASKLVSDAFDTSDEARAFITQKFGTETNYRYSMTNHWEDVPETIPGFLQGLRSRLVRVAASLKQDAERVTESERQIASIRNEMGHAFKYASELAEARQELTEVNLRLQPPKEQAKDDALLDVEDDPNSKPAESGATDNPVSPDSQAGRMGDVPPPIARPGSRNPLSSRSSLLPVSKPPLTLNGKTYDPTFVKVSKKSGRKVAHENVAGWEIAPGLTVTDGENGKYRVTHAQSGLAIGNVFDSPEQAVAYAERLAKVTDWTRSQEDLSSDPDVRTKMRQIAGERGSIPLFTAKAPSPIPEPDVPSPDSDIERLFADDGAGKSVWTRIREIPDSVYKTMSSGGYISGVDLSGLHDYPEFAEKTRRAMENIVDGARYSQAGLSKVLHGLHPVELDVMRRLIGVQDMLQTLTEMGEDAVPMDGQDKEIRLRAEGQRLQSIATDAVRAAGVRHYDLMKDVWQAAADLDLVDLHMGREWYFPNTMLNTVGPQISPTPGAPMKMQDLKNSNLRSRRGHADPHDMNYIRVMDNYLTRMHTFLANYRYMMDAAVDNDVRSKMSKSELQSTLAKTKGQVIPHQTYRDSQGNTLKGYQPKTGRLAYPVQAINNKVLEDAVNAGLDELTIDLDQYRKNLPDPELVTNMGEPLTETVLATGKFRKTYLLPAVIADKLENFRESQKIGPFAVINRKAMQAWKMIAITFSGLHYHVGNMLGDEIGLYVEDMLALANNKEALALLRGKLTDVDSQALMEMIQDARVWNSTFIASGGVPQAIHSPELREFRKESWMNPVGDFLRAYQRAGQIREGIPKVAKFIADYRRHKQGLPVVFKGNDIGGLDPSSMLAVGRNAREQSGDFGKVSPRDRLFYNLAAPFLPWHVLTMGQWARRAAFKKWAFPGDYMLVALGVALYGTAWAYNHYMYPDVEAALEDWQKEVLHINTGLHDELGNPQTILLETPADVFAKWIGLHTISKNLDKVIDGEWTIDQAVHQQVHDIFGFADNAALPTAAGAQLESLMNPIAQVFMDLRANKNRRTGRPIVSKDNPNLFGDPNKVMPQTETGLKMYGAYAAQQLISPYMQFIRASQSDDPDGTLQNWFTNTGPFSWKRALGLSAVHAGTQQSKDYQSNIKMQEALRDEKIREISSIYLEFSGGNLDQAEAETMIRKIMQAPGLNPTGPAPLFPSEQMNAHNEIPADDVSKIMQRPSFRVQMDEMLLRKTTDPDKRRAIADEIATIRFQQSLSQFDALDERLKTTSDPAKPSGRPYIEMPPVPWASKPGALPAVPKP